MANRKTPGRVAAEVRSKILRKLKRMLKDYDKPTVTDFDLKQVLGEVIKFIQSAPSRYNAKPGGLGK